MRTRFTRLAAGIMLVVSASVAMASAEAKPSVIVDTRSVWRSYATLKAPVIEFDDGLKPVLTGRYWLDEPTAEPPADWNTPGFDDTTWLRGSVRMAPWTQYASRICLRARFEVTDAAAVAEPSLHVDYHGGIIVYLNGTEIARRHLLPQGNGGLAGSYPPEAFLGEDGKILPSSWVVERQPERLALRKRSADITIPPDALRKGVNVLAIEVIRAPYHKVLDEKKGEGRSKRDLEAQGTPYDLPWHTCEIVDVILTAADDTGVVPNAGRPAGLQVWNGDLLTSDYDTDVGDRCEPLRPVALVGPRNAAMSGKVIVGSRETLVDLKAVPGDLKAEGGGTIPAASVVVRYGYPWGSESSSGDGSRGPSSYPRGAAMLDALLDEPLPEFSAHQKQTAPGVVVPVWITVKIPKDAAAGTYRGRVTVSAQGQQAVSVPVTVKVLGWTMPDTQDFRTWVELIQSPDSVAMEYDVPFWSERHWELMAKSFRHIGETGSRVVYVPLIAHTNCGNQESMVRWIRKGENQYDFDFSLMDRYLDIAQENMGTPKIVAFTAWEIYLSPPKQEIIIAESDSSYVKMEKSWKAARWELRDRGPAITVLDPATGEISLEYLPRFEAPPAKPIWTALFAALRERMRARGLEDAMMLAMLCDTWPTKAELQTLHEASGGLPWVMHTHGGSRVRPKIHGIADIGYTAYVWDVDYNGNPRETRMYGWKNPRLLVQFKRFSALNQWPATSLCHFAEVNITGAQRGVGRIGADFWKSIRDKRGRRAGQVWGRYPQSAWHSLNMFNHLLAPGPNGPVSTGQMEVFREGVQECEARIFIEDALTDEGKRAKLGRGLSDRCQEALDERMDYMWRGASNLQLTGRAGAYASKGDIKYCFGGVAGHRWFAATNWQARTELLYSLAAEVATALAAEQAPSPM